MKKLIIFDLDGVIIDSRQLHYDCLNKALAEVDLRFTISEEEQHTIYDGLPTMKKLEMLTEYKNLPRKFHQQIWTRKQEITTACLLNDTSRDDKLISIFKYLISKGVEICVASNSIRNTIDIILESKKVKTYVSK